ncbi:unnamed protein product [Bursaphelenchus xylophilus]|uniref:(pine wood nematode) hypothetical protein n=1 Tax=Bursaphelenchus xylophilus TaxID=6326 RepID=A0A7I8XAL5_BURXY|nr:unnamed protein product [Bursaphelenchus xylophilus]CAG9082647.1 unnamed protein product [Bursaphelenchus xylophilus]
MESGVEEKAWSVVWYSKYGSAINYWGRAETPARPTGRKWSGQPGRPEIRPTGRNFGPARGPAQAGPGRPGPGAMSSLV